VVPGEIAPVHAVSRAHRSDQIRQEISEHRDLEATGIMGGCCGDVRQRWCRGCAQVSWPIIRTA
jgi:hypothetical protein